MLQESTITEMRDWALTEAADEVRAIDSCWARIQRLADTARNTMASNPGCVSTETPFLVGATATLQEAMARFAGVQERVRLLLQQKNSPAQ